MHRTILSACGLGATVAAVTMTVSCSSGKTGPGSTGEDASATTTGSSSSSGGGSALGTSSSSGGGSSSGGSSSSDGGSGEGGMGEAGRGEGGPGFMCDGGSPSGMTCGGGTAMASDISVNVGSFEQKISGFGASTAYGENFADPANDPDTLWSTTKGAGFSLHRIQINDNNGMATTDELPVAQKAVSYGVTVWATPWNPPQCPPDLQTYGMYLAQFVSNMKAAGVPIYAVSAQNEPDGFFCNYTADALASWIGMYMGPALASSGVKIMAPETQNWCSPDDFPGYESAMMSNTAAWNATDIVATHEYGCAPSAHPEIAKAGKEFWETEIYDMATVTDNGIVSGLRTASLIHGALTVANMNAWHYWWTYSVGNAGLYEDTTHVWTKRLWIMGNYSRFVRPGYMRVDTSGEPTAICDTPEAIPGSSMNNDQGGMLPCLEVTAYTNACDGTVVIVVINHNMSATPVSFFVSGAAPCSFTPWITDATNDLVSQTAIAVSSGRFSASLGAQSVTTFVGKP